MAVRVYIPVVSCVLLIGGCISAPRQPTTRSSSVRPTSMSGEMLVVGMDLGDALEMLTRHGIEFQIAGGEWAPMKEVVAAQKFDIERRDIDDAFMIYAESEHGERMRVRDLYWYRNYQDDMKRLKGVRKRQYAHVKSLYVAEIERKFSSALNPYDSEKAAAREGKP